MSTYYQGNIRFINYAGDHAIVKESVLIPQADHAVYSVATVNTIQGTTSTQGSQSLKSSITPIVGANTSLIPAGTYNIQIKKDAASSYTSYPVVVPSSGTWTQVVSALDTAFTTTNGTVTLVANAIVVTSATTGVTSAISIIDGNTSGLISEINAITASTTSIAASDNKLVYLKGDFSSSAKYGTITYSYTDSSDYYNLITIE